MSGRWSPLRTDSRFVVEPGQLVAFHHGVWRVQGVKDGAVDLEHVGGALPEWATDSRPICGVVRPPDHFIWAVYRTERWPACSCCGEPVPCRAEVEEREVAAALDSVAAMEAKMPGCCWACNQPISLRQVAVRYEGDNLDLPGAPAPVFHARRACRYSAERYELRWLARDPRRERILTYPKCGGRLLVHADGSSECVGGRDPLFGKELHRQPDCEGHLTHDHGVVSACYLSDEDFLRHPSRHVGTCPRGCSREGHHGTRTSRRPVLRKTAAPVVADLGLGDS